ncbi:hypothetical protein MYCTH_2304699 [Thermothelomyces thermophilus ATCC 42464]|uniref:Uncharacterized protein n=1 Tax=Thermothelomyces thermophilus (strain ATCC 42464 / BCRC 31852 / DSM 1799) TaxID=573729 RepID=G2QBH8_THET4|nr:uncharacterized protein MYCTH_2304699 [Thermothelomyces thermophilus ATCC 42464]AEO57921.1 hypothetical protein MYCTH_2304699 [Thermothelomyces thermophilus ATCC 42464]
MLDENLPAFRLKQSSDNPHSSILYFTQNGSEPTPEYLIRRADPSLPAAQNKYGIAICDPYNTGVVYGEVVVEPEWSQPTLSAAEIRAQAQAGAPSAPAVAVVPDSFTVLLYNPDQSVTVKLVPGSWGKSDTWEFELPERSFRTPTASELDREQQNSSPAAADLISRIMFRWKKDGLLSKDMTCYMTGKRVGARKNKEPDITVALFKASRESVLTLYQPNLHRVELEDRKGLELVLLLASEVIKDFWLVPKPNLFNVRGGGTPVLNGAKRKNSRPAASAAVATPAAMSGALANVPPPQNATSTVPAAAPKTNTPPPPATIDAETRRLQAMVEREQREQREREKAEREKAERAEQKRIKKMLEEEEKERRRREAEVAKETERLRKLYGVEGQELPSGRPSHPPRTAAQPVPPSPGPPPVHTAAAPGGSPQQQLSPWGCGAPPALPPRPVSAGPYSCPPPPSLVGGGGHGGQKPQQQGPFHSSTLNALWKGAADGLHQLQSQGHGQGLRPSGRRKSEEERKRVQKKSSSHW